MSAKPIYPSKRSAALAALESLDRIRKDEAPVRFSGGKFNDDDAGWYFTISYTRTDGNTNNGRRSAEEVLRYRGEILDWMASPDEEGGS